MRGFVRQGGILCPIDFARGGKANLSIWLDSVRQSNASWSTPHRLTMPKSYKLGGMAQFSGFMPCTALLFAFINSPLPAMGSSYHPSPPTSWKCASAEVATRSWGCHLGGGRTSQKQKVRRNPSRDEIAHNTPQAVINALGAASAATGQSPIA